MKNLKMKINKSQLAREMGVNRSTINKYKWIYPKTDKREGINFR